MPEPQKRQIAYKARIADLINGGYVKEEGWTPNYIITKQGKHISRINLIGTVISKTEEGSEYQSLVVDDGSGTISLRLFEKNDNVKNIEIGDVVLLIGRPREYGSEKYIVPEIIKKINNKKWIDVRKIELGIENLKTKKDELGKEEVVVEKIDDSTKEKTASNPQIVYEAVKELDSGQGVDIDKVIKKTGIRDAEEIIKKFLREGEMFEIRPGKIKILE
ncbi:hypothetical protein COY26_04100 [Candidatus Woesearchaeota archaeon CG_4_10_14_0_2_um_filter_33_10]|nr:MAG: hypothetical protein COV14_00270 [Candidatus Woesearchaeota archaeon CG10_big_fil_rev_8_21_14_0_10_33_12]PIU72738.1 MAG: hypothetical protein COS79_01395 [Candidatus Woesearchaeota archaeon CG06_land_8_20_14_3_00_33_13]PIZ52650.1 MAG: hypothetical protein COY26_04100 [Candidatus Woesearchaeota archaeon CG_4_10_14_0_2_um_filter_33_10]